MFSLAPAVAGDVVRVEQLVVVGTPGVGERVMALTTVSASGVSKWPSIGISGIG